VDEFSYDPDFDDGIAGKNRGGGFSGAWNLAWGSLDIADYGFAEVDGYPKPYGNKLHIPYTGGGAYRNFSAVTSGKIYAAVFFNYGNETTGNWAGLSFMSNGVERVFFGGNSVAQPKMKLAIDSYGGARVDSNYDLNAGIGEDYVIIGRYDFSTHIFSTKAYYKTDTLPHKEPSNWDATATLAPSQMPYINGIRIAGGNDGGSNDPGDMYFDEVRVSTTWHGLMNKDEFVGATVFKFK
jgi:hypothetical protein